MISRVKAKDVSCKGANSPHDERGENMKTAKEGRAPVLIVVYVIFLLLFNFNLSEVEKWAWFILAFGSLEARILRILFHNLLSCVAVAAALRLCADCMCSNISAHIMSIC